MARAQNIRFVIGMIFVFVFGGVVSFVAAVEAPPNLVNHQFYGNVYWDANITVAPTQVDARLVDSTFSSLIQEIHCTEVLCSATYGQAADNILRVQGSNNGLPVTFFLGEKQVTQVTYKGGEAQALDLNIATTPISCTPNPDCTEWTGCLNDKQNRSCYDVNKCGPAAGWNKTEEQGCGANSEASRSRSNSANATSGSSSSGCSMTWGCSLWSLCVGSEQRRVCSRSDVCGASAIFSAKPEESKVCGSGTGGTSSTGSSGLPVTSNTAVAETCFDGVLNQDERGIDCGGACKPCPEKKVAASVVAESSNTLLIAGVSILAILVIGLIVFLIIHKKKVAAISGSGSSGSSVLTASIISQLDFAYAKGEASGMSRGDVTAKLTEKGWDTEMLEEYLISK